VVLDPAGITFSSNLADREKPWVKANGAGYLVYWRDQVGQFRVARVTGQGVVQDPGGVRVLGNPYEGVFDVATDGTDYLVVHGYPNGSGLVGARVSAAGTVLDPFGITISTAFSTSVVSGLEPHVSYGNGNYLVTWRDTAAGGIRMRRVSSQGQLVDAVPFFWPVRVGGTVSTPAGEVPWRTGLAYDGDRFVVAWGSAGTSWAPVPLTLQYVAGDAQRLIGSPISLTTELAPALEPGLALNGSGQVLLTYSPDTGRDLTGVPRSSLRVRAQLLQRDSRALGVACTSAVDCASGHCTDGVCCDSACDAGQPDRCGACSVAAGAATNGTCAPVAAGTVCRASAAACDAVEACTGASTVCPADGLSPATTVCRTSAGVCDVAESCTGASAACPADGLVPATTVCRASVGPGDVAETCTGTGTSCPIDTGRAPDAGVPADAAVRLDAARDAGATGGADAGSVATDAARADAPSPASDAAAPDAPSPARDATAADAPSADAFSATSDAAAADAPSAARDAAGADAPARTRDGAAGNVPSGVADAAAGADAASGAGVRRRACAMVAGQAGSDQAPLVAFLLIGWLVRRRLG
jgi:hypothetical protein